MDRLFDRKSLYGLHLAKRRVPHVPQHGERLLVTQDINADAAVWVHVEVIWAVVGGQVQMARVAIGERRINDVGGDADVDGQRAVSAGVDVLAVGAGDYI